MDWSKLIQTIVTGLADGGIYAVLALALVLIHRATGVINFAQGEMAMFSTYIAFWLISDPEGWELSFWIGFAITLAISFAGGALIYGAIIRPLARSGQITIVIATIALLIILNGAGGLDLDRGAAIHPQPVPVRPGDDRRRRHPQADDLHLRHLARSACSSSTSSSASRAPA